jgi:hypothetical protein
MPIIQYQGGFTREQLRKLETGGWRLEAGDVGGDAGARRVVCNSLTGSCLATQCSAFVRSGRRSLYGSHGRQTVATQCSAFVRAGRRSLQDSAVPGRSLGPGKKDREATRQEPGPERCGESRSSWGVAKRLTMSQAGRGRMPQRRMRWLPPFVVWHGPTAASLPAVRAGAPGSLAGG